MKGKVMAAFGLALGIAGTVISIVAIVLSACSLGRGRRPSHLRSLDK